MAPQGKLSRVVRFLRMKAAAPQVPRRVGSAAKVQSFPTKPLSTCRLKNRNLVITSMEAYRFGTGPQRQTCARSERVYGFHAKGGWADPHSQLGP
eukprot:9178765-Pyramimonas_sp.AAC.1